MTRKATGNKKGKNKLPGFNSCAQTPYVLQKEQSAITSRFRINFLSVGSQKSTFSHDC